MLLHNLRRKREGWGREEVARGGALRFADNHHLTTRDNIGKVHGAAARDEERVDARTQQRRGHGMHHGAYVQIGIHHIHVGAMVGRELGSRERLMTVSRRERL